MLSTEPEHFESFVARGPGTLQLLCYTADEDGPCVGYLHGSLRDTTRDSSVTQGVASVDWVPDDRRYLRGGNISIPMRDGMEARWWWKSLKGPPAVVQVIWHDADGFQRL